MSSLNALTGLGRRRRRTTTRRGRGFFGDLWNGIKSVAGPINSVLKSTGIAGNLASAYNPTLGATVKALGYGKRRTLRRSMTGMRRRRTKRRV